jgi:glycosyltransferase involved in cell wall biosynthesis
MRAVPDLSPRVLVVIPAYNEVGSIARVIAGVHAEAPFADILVVDDGSTDGTAELARGMGATVASLPYNLGVGGAMRTGYRHAYRQGYDAVVQVDADGQHDPRYIASLVAGLDRDDLVIGARFAGTGEYAVHGPRWWAMRLIAAVMSRLVGVRLDDATSGFRAAGRRAIPIYAHHYPTEYLGDTLETLVIARKSGLSVSQLPVAMHPRLTGTPTHGFAGSAVELTRACAIVIIGMVRDWSITPEAGTP